MAETTAETIEAETRRKIDLTKAYDFNHYVEIELKDNNTNCPVYGKTKQAPKSGTYKIYGFYLEKEGRTISLKVKGDENTQYCIYEKDILKYELKDRFLDGGTRKSRKTRKTRKTRKSRKSRKTRKTRKNKNL
jgi:hypothetical protein